MIQLTLPLWNTHIKAQNGCNVTEQFECFLTFQAFWLPTIDDWWQLREGFCWRRQSNWPAGVSTDSSVNFTGSVACSIQIVNKLFAEVDHLSILFLNFYLTLNRFFVRSCFCQLYYCVVAKCILCNPIKYLSDLTTDSFNSFF